MDVSTAVTLLDMDFLHVCSQRSRSLQVLLVCRAEGNGDGLLVAHVLAIAVRGKGAGAARRIEEAGVDLAVTGQAGEDPSPLLQGVCKDLHDLDAWHVPACLHSLWYLHPINPAQQSTRCTTCHTGLGTNTLHSLWYLHPINPAQQSTRCTTCHIRLSTTALHSLKYPISIQKTPFAVAATQDWGTTALPSLLLSAPHQSCIARRHCLHNDTGSHAGLGAA